MTRNIQIKFLLFILLLITVQPVSGQQNEEPYQSNTVLLPFLSYSPETSLMMGGLVMTQFKPKTAGRDTRTSQLIFSTVYTLNRQLMVELTPGIFLTNESWLFEGRYEYSFFPDNYWGTGAFSKGSDQLDLEFRALDLQQAILKKIGEHLHAGLNLRWSRVTRVKFFDEDGDPVYDENTSGAGIRYNLNPQDTTNLRIDYGIGKHGSGLYITLGEAF